MATQKGLPKKEDAKNVKYADEIKLAAKPSFDNDVDDSILNQVYVPKTEPDMEDDKI